MGSLLIIPTIRALWSLSAVWRMQSKPFPPVTHTQTVGMRKHKCTQACFPANACEDIHTSLSGVSVGWMRRRWTSIEVLSRDHCCEWALRWWWLDRERQSSWAQDLYLTTTVGGISQKTVIRLQEAGGWGAKKIPESNLRRNIKQPVQWRSQTKLRPDPELGPHL